MEKQFLTSKEKKDHYKKRAKAAFDFFKSKNVNWQRLFEERHLHEYVKGGFTQSSLKVLLKNVASGASYDEGITEKMEKLANDLKAITKPIKSK